MGIQWKGGASVEEGLQQRSGALVEGRGFSKGVGLQ